MTISRRRLTQASVGSAVVTRTAAIGAAIVVTHGAAQAATTTVERYILTRLSQSNVKKLFGVPGATCSPIFEAAQSGGDVSLVVTSSDLGAGYAADGYARTRGLAAVSVTYGVGMMSLLTAIAGAYVERSPIVIINGGPSAEDLRLQRDLGTLFSHSTGHEKRLKRATLDKHNGFGSDPYCKEELIAEMGAAFLCGQAEIVERTVILRGG